MFISSLVLSLTLCSFHHWYKYKKNVKTERNKNCEPSLNAFGYKPMVRGALPEKWIPHNIKVKLPLRPYPQTSFGQVYVQHTAHDQPIYLLVLLRVPKLLS